MLATPWKYALLLAFLCALTAQAAAQSEHRYLRRGDRAHKEKRLDQASEDYRGALEQDNSAQGNYNLGTTLYDQENYADAAKKFEEAAALAEDGKTKGDAYHNLGNSLFQQQQYEKSAQAYQRALREQPEDMETRHNMSLALRKLQQQQQEKQQQQGEGESDEQQEGDPQQQEGEGEGEQQQGEAQQQPSDRQPSGKQPQPGGKLSREEAERQLEIAREAEEETMQKMRGGAQSNCNSGKDW